MAIHVKVLIADDNEWDSERLIHALKQGEYDWSTVSPVYDEEGHYKGMTVLVADAVERKLAEESVRESEELFRLMADAAPMIIAMLDSNGQVEYVNKTAEIILGMPVDELLADQWRSLVHPDDVEPLLVLLNEAITQRKECSFEYRFKRGQGEYGWFYSLYSPRFTESGKFAGLVGCTIDITARKNTEEALSRSLEKEKLISRIVEFNSQSLNVADILNFTAKELGAFLNVDRCLVVKYQGSIYDTGNLPRLLGAYEKGPQILKVEEAYIPRVNFPDSEIIRKKHNFRLCLDIQAYSQIPPALVEYASKYKIQAMLAYDVTYRNTIYGRIVLHQCEQPRVWTLDEKELLESVITHLGNALYQVELYQKEQSARRSLEEGYKLLEVYTRKVERSNLELENFAALASHDLQSPLRKIATFGDLLAKNAGQQLDEESRDYLARMKAAIARMQTLITDLLDLSSVNRKGKPFGSTRLDEVVRLAVDDLSEQIESSQAEVNIHADCELEADKEQLQQVLMNLIENGLKFSKQGEPPKINIEAEALDDQTCLLKVVDQGIGIKPEHQEKIFEVFTRLHTQEAYPGTGIGLSLVKRIIERHQGEIWLESEPGKGSSFLIRLPLRHL